MSARVWRARSFELPLERTLVMGVLNVTPDSFWDGGRYLDPAAAIERAHRMVEEGADVIDIGAESSRPGSEPISGTEELERLMPVLERVVAEVPVPVSVDTYKPAVASCALQAGASILNDITGFRDPRMVEILVDSGAGAVVMHMQGEPRTMQRNPTYADVVGEVRSFLLERAEALVAAGAAREQIMIDPGIGFGKTAKHNLELMRRLGDLAETGYPVLVGPSRKSIIGAVLGLPPEERLEGTAACVAMCIAAGASCVRVHDVKEMVRVARMCDAIMGRWQWEGGPVGAARP